MKPVDAETRTRALVLVEEGYSFRAVGTRLGVLHKTVPVHKHCQAGPMHSAIWECMSGLVKSTGAKVPCGRTSTSECSETTCSPQQHCFIMVRSRRLASSKTIPLAIMRGGYVLSSSALV